MKLTVLIEGGRQQSHWMEVHRTGCKDLAKHRGSDPHNLRWVEDHDSLTDAAESFASDFIAEGSMTVETALRDVHFAPCVTLPLYSPAQVAEALRVTYQIMFDGPYSSIERCDVAPDGVSVFGSFAEAKAELLSHLKAGRDLWSDAVRLARELRASDVAGQ